MSDENESVGNLLARREYDRAVPILRRDVEKYPSNVRLHLQLADALAGAGEIDDALKEYSRTAEFYEENGLTVQAIAVRKKYDRLQEKRQASVVEERSPKFSQPLPKSPLFDHLEQPERDALGAQMELESFEEGDIIISEGEPGSSLYVVVHGEVKVFGRDPRGESVYLAKLSDGDFFGEVSVLTGKPRTATITASQPSELLRLDKDKLDEALVSHPRIRKVLEEFYWKRANHTVEAMVESLKHKKES